MANLILQEALKTVMVQLDRVKDVVTKVTTRLLLVSKYDPYGNLIVWGYQFLNWFPCVVPAPVPTPGLKRRGFTSGFP